MREIAKLRAELKTSRFGLSVDNLPEEITSMEPLKTNTEYNAFIQKCRNDTQFRNNVVSVFVFVGVCAHAWTPDWFNLLVWLSILRGHIFAKLSYRNEYGISFLFSFYIIMLQCFHNYIKSFFLSKFSLFYFKNGEKLMIKWLKRFNFMVLKFKL